MSLRRQAASLAIMHAADIAQPLLLLPYAGRILGAQHFGEYVYALSIGQFAATIVEYGFHWTAQRAAASARQEPAKLASLFAEVVATKATFCVLVTLAGLAAANGLLPISRSMFLCAMTNAVGGILFPAWLLIGLERAWQATLATVIARSVTFIGFVTLVVSPAQVEVAVTIQSAVPLICGVVTLPFVAAIGVEGLRSVTLSGIARQVVSGSRGFLYSFVERASIALPMLLVGYYGGYVAAGQYSIAEKCIGATRPFFRIMCDTFLPRVAFYAQHDPKTGLRLIWISLSTCVVGAGLSLGLFILAPYVIPLAFGDLFTDAVSIVRLMSIIPLLINLNLCTSNLYMFNYGHERAWSSLIAASLLVLLSVAYLLLLTLSNAATAVAVAVIAKEAVVLVVSAGFFLAAGVPGMRIATVNLAGVMAASSIPAVVRTRPSRPVGSTPTIE
jgi:O-antigen/teichoic acid export membrane protein